MTLLHLPSTPKGTRSAPKLTPMNKENVPFVPTQPNHSNLPRQPSAGWLRQPAWIDGGVNPPIYFYSNEDIVNTLRVYCLDHPYLQPQRPQPPTACNSLPPGSSAASHVVTGSAVPSPLATTPTVLESEQEVCSSASAPEDMSRPPPISEPSGHMVSITMVFALPERGPGLRAKTIMKKHRNIKFDNIKVAELDRVAFISEFLRVHELNDQYSPGVHNGPPFKMWWMGSSGGKSGAITIDSDREYKVAIDALLKKNQTTCQVGIEFDVDGMEGFHISRKRPLSQVEASESDTDPELLYGTKVPRLDDYSELEQRHGLIISQLKQKWSCEKHQGEHGEPGFCYVDSTGGHLGLNNRKLKIWASAIAAADATKHEPPNTVEFDGIRDGRLSSVKPRGRTGSHQTHSPSTSTDVATMLMAAMIPILSNLAPKAPVLDVPTTPTRQRPLKPAIALSPIPSPTSQLHVCLADFASVKGIDLLSSESALAELDLTPDIVPIVPVARLCEVTNAVEGQMWKLQAFCREWSDHLEEKKRRT